MLTKLSPLLFLLEYSCFLASWIKNCHLLCCCVPSEFFPCKSTRTRLLLGLRWGLDKVWPCSPVQPGFSLYCKGNQTWCQNCMKSISKTHGTPLSGSRFQGFYLFVCLAKSIVPKEILRPWDSFNPVIVIGRDMSVSMEYLHPCWRGFHITKSGWL